MKYHDQPHDEPLWSWPEHTGTYSLMGVLNVTPDSFFDGGAYYKLSDSSGRPSHKSLAGTRANQLIDHAVNHALDMLKSGAKYIDVGGESSRPGAEAITLDEELARVIPVIEELSLRAPEAVISIDTVKPLVAQRALECGAKIINDINGLSDPQMRQVAAHYKAGVVIMHMRGVPKTMQEGDLSAADIVEEVWTWLHDAANRALASSLTPAQIALDVGIGFGKTVEQNLSLLRGLGRFTKLGYPLLVGVSRKSMIGAITGATTQDRLPGSLAAMIEARRRGGAIFRVHDVSESAQALAVSEAISQNIDMFEIGSE